MINNYNNNMNNNSNAPTEARMKNKQQSLLDHNGKLIDSYSDYS